jgi:hypothetical protein
MRRVLLHVGGAALLLGGALGGAAVLDLTTDEPCPTGWRS